MMMGHACPGTIVAADRVRDGDIGGQEPHTPSLPGMACSAPWQSSLNTCVVQPQSDGTRHIEIRSEHVLTCPHRQHQKSRKICFQESCAS
jgi:hypothetical protein